jgi:hypothetical protein
VFELRRGTSLTDQQWVVVSEHLDRIDRARVAQDWPLVVGSAKELVESVARFAVDHGGISVGNRVDLRSLVEAAHGVLERPDHEEFASDLPTARIIKQVKHAVCELAELRNALGTGHGSATRKATLEEHADVAMDAAITWCRWALRRLAAVKDGRYSELIDDLRRRSFYKHDLRDRLLAVNLRECSADEQHAIGVAVGRRAATGTFTVREEGVEAAAARDPDWPLPYRVGVAEGLLLTEDGFLRSDALAVRFLAPLVVDLDDAGHARFEELKAQIQSDVSYANGPSERQDIARALQESDHVELPPVVRDVLSAASARFEAPT